MFSMPLGIVMFSNLLHPRNAWDDILFTPSRTTTLTIEVYAYGNTLLTPLSQTY